VFHMFFLVKYCKALEEGSFRSRSSDFLWMLIFGASTCVWGTCTRVSVRHCLRSYLHPTDPAMPTSTQVAHCSRWWRPL
jgi:Der1-like family